MRTRGSGRWAVSSEYSLSGTVHRFIFARGCTIYIRFHPRRYAEPLLAPIPRFHFICKFATCSDQPRIRTMEPDNGLVFVNVAHPDEIHAKDTQRTIRKRVMRDIGRSRRRQKRIPALTFAWQPTSISPTVSLESSPLPVELDPRARELIHFSMTVSDPRFFYSELIDMQCTPKPTINIAHSEQSGSPCLCSTIAPSSWPWPTRLCFWMRSTTPAPSATSTAMKRCSTMASVFARSPTGLQIQQTAPARALSPQFSD